MLILGKPSMNLLKGDSNLRCQHGLRGPRRPILGKGSNRTGGTVDLPSGRGNRGSLRSQGRSNGPGDPRDYPQPRVLRRSNRNVSFLSEPRELRVRPGRTEYGIPRGQRGPDPHGQRRPRPDGRRGAIPPWRGPHGTGRTILLGNQLGATTAGCPRGPRPRQRRTRLYVGR